MDPNTPPVYQSIPEQPVTRDLVSEPKVLNGGSPAPAPAMHKRTAWIEMPAPYAGYKVLIWLNHPTTWNDRLRVAAGDDRYKLLGEVFLQHNQWQDYNGEVLPGTNTEEFWESIPDELGMAMIAALQTEKQKLPNSVRRKSEL